MASINTGILGDTAFVAPIDIAEQVMIGSIFFSLDHLITLHQRKLIDYAVENMYLGTA